MSPAGRSPSVSWNATSLPMGRSTSRTVTSNDRFGTCTPHVVKNVLSGAVNSTVHVLDKKQRSARVLHNTVVYYYVGDVPCGRRRRAPENHFLLVDWTVKRSRTLLF